MLVSSERNLFVFHRSQFDREGCGHATQEVELVLVRGDRAQGFFQHILEMMDVRLLGLDCFLVLDESFKRLYDAVLVCHS